MERKEFNDQYAAWIVEKIRRDFPEDVSMALVYGSYINGTAGAKSDLDCYFIPKTQRGYELARTFLFDDVGYDLFPMDWHRVEGIASLEEGLPPLLGDVQILYSASQEDSARFAALQALQKQNLQDEEYVRRVAAKKCHLAARYCGEMKADLPLNHIRKIAGGMIMVLADAVALYNHDYFHRGTKMQYPDLLSRFPEVPESIPGFYRQTVEAMDADAVIQAAAGMLEAVCQYIGIPVEVPADAEMRLPADGTMDAGQLAGLYEEISATFQKVYLCCENGNHILAFLSAVVLQNELDLARSLGCPAMDLLSQWNPAALPCFADWVRKCEAALVALILENGGKLRHYHSFEEFVAEN